MKNILFLFVLTGCALFSKGPELSPTAKEVPAWVYAPYDVCQETSELCATGEGKSFDTSDLQARKNLASIFEVSIRSETNIQTSTTMNNFGQGSVRQDVEESLRESVDQVLETVQIKRHFKHQGLAHSLASLDKTLASEILGQRLNKLDDELETLWTRKSRTDMRRILRLYLEREKANERYSIVSGTGRPARMTYKEIMDWKASVPTGETVMIKVGQAPEWMKNKLNELLTEAGFKLVSGKASKVLSLNVDSIKEFLNVNGFEKYTFSMTVAHISQGQKRAITLTETVTGRTQEDALLKVKTLFNDYIEQHLSDLRLD